MKLRNTVTGLTAVGILATGCNPPEANPEQQATTRVVAQELKDRGFVYRGIEPIHTNNDTFTFPNVGIGSSVCVLARVEVTTTPDGDVKDIALIDKQFDEGQTDVQGDAYVFGNTPLTDSATLVYAMEPNDRAICFPS